MEQQQQEDGIWRAAPRGRECQGAGAGCGDGIAHDQLRFTTRRRGSLHISRSAVFPFLLHCPRCRVPSCRPSAGHEKLSALPRLRCRQEGGAVMLA